MIRTDYDSPKASTRVDPASRFNLRDPVTLIDHEGAQVVEREGHVIARCWLPTGWLYDVSVGPGAPLNNRPEADLRAREGALFGVLAR